MTAGDRQAFKIGPYFFFTRGVGELSLGSENSSKTGTQGRRDGRDACGGGGGGLSKKTHIFDLHMLCAIPYHYDM